MANDRSEIEKFFTTVAGFDQVVISGEEEWKQALLSQEKLIFSLNENLKKLSLSQKELDSLSTEIEKVIGKIRITVNIIDKSTKEKERSIKLQREYKERLIILVFGKVNVGKSSFSNYFVSLFPQTLVERPYFFFENGEKKYSSDPFKVGSTETTARIQGVELGKLVLLDTPGLHSITEKNHELTKQYTDSADLILWLSGSNSPGQTQELEELKNEIENGKVLFPIITKSDLVEEDEENGEIIKKLIMKSSDDQQLQQGDVYKRAKDKLRDFNINDLNKLHNPVSLSIYYAKAYPEQQNIMLTAGISALFSGINEIYDEVIESKKNNVRTQVKNHLKTINNHLTINIATPFNELQKTLTSQKKQIQEKSKFISDMSIDSVRAQLPAIISKYSQEKNVKGITKDVNQTILTEANKQLDIEFEAIFKSLLQAVAIPKNSGLNIESSFEDETISYEYQRGALKKSITSGLGSAGGAALGFAFFGPAGAVIGGLIGGVGGNKAGEYFIETETMTKVIGVDSAKVEAELNIKLQKVMPKLIDNSINSLLEQFKPLEKVIEQSIEEIELFTQSGYSS